MKLFNIICNRTVGNMIAMIVVIFSLSFLAGTGAKAYAAERPADGGHSECYPICEAFWEDEDGVLWKQTVVGFADQPKIIYAPREVGRMLTVGNEEAGGYVRISSGD